MARLVPTDPGLLAAAVADSLVVAADPEASAASLYYWQLNRTHCAAVADAAKAFPVDEVREPAVALLENPPAQYFTLRRALAHLIERRPETTSALTSLAWEAECFSRLGYHQGERYRAQTPGPVGWQELATRPPGERLGAQADPAVLIVIPFRESDPAGGRLRNLLACLQALRDQSADRGLYRVTVVEADSEPRWREVVEPFCDHYVFAPRAGRFNKSWAVNVGAVHSPGDPGLLCVHDADVLSDREFVERNAGRFLRTGNGGHLPYRTMSCLDEASSVRAIHDRATGEASLDALRAFQLRRPPGACLWLRMEAFRRINGMDERYEGWGGEDNDLFRRAETEAPFNIYDDTLLHLKHKPSSVLGDGGEVVNAHIPPLSWPLTEPIGRLG